ncbi:YciI family protein [Paenibacillus sp. 32352]|uniref:YciI family protein n=1 Tax=Paenibacillus sp. 32352 TaxID=1969111 RepID=UPI0009AD6221|nr:YciI family protein [Paenibacillus sp. 32352]
MKHYVVFLPMLDEEKSQTYRAQHLEYLLEMRSRGHIFANGRFVDGAGGMVIYRAESLEAVEAFVLNDPYVIHQARGYEIHEWDMVLAD